MAWGQREGDLLRTGLSSGSSCSWPASCFPSWPVLGLLLLVPQLGLPSLLPATTVTSMGWSWAPGAFSALRSLDLAYSRV